MPVAETTASPIPVIRDPSHITEIAIEEHRQRMEQKRLERMKRLPEQIACLDAEHAAAVENRKQAFRWSVECTVQDYDQKLKRQVAVKKTGEVDAQNEEEAWAKFCDKFKVRSGPAHCNRKIKKVTQPRSAV